MYYGAFINKCLPGRNEHDQLWVDMDSNMISNK